jgi:glutamyl/glutaminyl-tRNA synthetase
VDDHLMKIDVIRGEEWVSSTRSMFFSIGILAGMPRFAHLPPLNPKSKLSKRQGDVAVEDYAPRFS